MVSVDGRAFRKTRMTASARATAGAAGVSSEARKETEKASEVRLYSMA